MAIDPSEDELVRTLGAVEDESIFEESWEKFSKQFPHLDQNHDKKFARIWFGRGIERGLEWFESEFERQIGK